MVESFTPSAQVYNVDIQDNVCKMKEKHPKKLYCTKACLCNLPFSVNKGAFLIEFFLGVLVLNLH